MQILIGGVAFNRKGKVASILAGIVEAEPWRGQVLRLNQAVHCPTSHRCVDLDGDGVIRPREMLYFYEEQLRRLEGWNQEPVQFEDLLCQLHDMLAPAKEGAFTLR